MVHDNYLIKFMTAGPYPFFKKVKISKEKYKGNMDDVLYYQEKYKRNKNNSKDLEKRLINEMEITSEKFKSGRLDRFNLISHLLQCLEIQERIYYFKKKYGLEKGGFVNFCKYSLFEEDDSVEEYRSIKYAISNISIEYIKSEESISFEKELEENVKMYGF